MLKILSILFLFIKRSGRLRCCFKNSIWLNESQKVYLVAHQELQKKDDTTSFVSKTILGNSYIESNIEQDIDWINHLKMKNYQTLLILRMMLQNAMLILSLAILV